MAAKTMPTEIEPWCEALASSLLNWGRQLYVAGSMIGGDRVAGRTQRGHGDDRVVAFGSLLEIAGELSAGSCDLLRNKRLYAAGALVRQVIEVEYLLWAFEADDAEARRWLQADRKTLLQIFSPGNIRKQAGDEFAASEYHAHCNLGGHPSPSSAHLLVGHGMCLPVEFMWMEVANHLMRTWDRAVACWAKLDSEGAIMGEMPSLVDALRPAAGVSLSLAGQPAPSAPNLIDYEIDSATGRISVGLTLDDQEVVSSAQVDETPLA